MAKSAVELAREYGVDIAQLQLTRSRTPIQRLHLMQAVARFVIKGRAAVQKQKEKMKHDRQTRF